MVYARPSSATEATVSTTPPGTADRRLHTAFCDLVGVRYPIIQTGMGWVSGSRPVSYTHLTLPTILLV